MGKIRGSEPDSQAHELLWGLPTLYARKLIMEMAPLRKAWKTM
jgi:hypothetical protein